MLILNNEKNRGIFLDSYKKLAKNSFVFAIGTMGSKLILLLLVPLYTYYLTTEEYGITDLIITTTSLLFPIISANIFDSVLRFVMEKDESKEKVITNAFFVSLIGIGIFFVLYPFIRIVVSDVSLVNYFYIILIFQIFQTILGQFTRAVGEVRSFALNGIVMAIVTGVSNVILLTFFQLGIDGYLISIILSNVISIFYLSLKVKILSQIHFSLIDYAFIKKMLKYCIPIIPNSIMWWLINASNRYFILFFVGASANGIYAVANKIPNILSLVGTVFYQAWQLSAIEEYKNKNNSIFYSKIFGIYSAVLLLGSSFIILLSRFIMQVFMAEQYYEGWKVIPFLLLSVVFSSLSSFLGANYLAAKQTNGVFKTSMYGGLVSLILNAILVPSMGIQGSAIGTMISFALMCYIRLIDTKKFIELKIDIKLWLLNFIFIIFQIINLFIIPDLLIQISIGSVLFLLQVFCNKNILIIFNKVLLFGVKKLTYNKKN